MVRVTDDKEVKEAVLAGLQRNKEKYGKRYCPCSLVRDDDTVCMCKEFRELEEGMCHCQLYVKTKDVDFPSHVDNSSLSYTSKSFKINFNELQ